MNGNTITATLKQPRATHTEQQNVMLPTGEELSKVIQVTHKWNDLFATMELQGKLSELSSALEQLPASDVRDCRLSVIFFRQKKGTAAKNILGRHKESVVAKAYDLTFRIWEGQYRTFSQLQELEEVLARLGRADGREVTFEGVKVA